MPEGHKTHFIAAQHADQLLGQTLKVTSPQGRFRAGARHVSGRVLQDVEAVGKHLFYHFDADRMIHIHLGRYGKFRVYEHPAPKPVGKVRLRMKGKRTTIDLNGPTVCEVIDSAQRQLVLDRLGPDPLGGGRKADALKLISDSKRPIGTLLLDQSIIAGVGNIFRAELLFQLQLDPETRGCEIPESTLNQLWRSLKKMMQTGLRYGRIITVTAKEAGQPLSKIQGGDRFRIYGKDDCPTCDEPIQTIELAARKLYYCPVCQRSSIDGRVR